ncbi:MAG: VWA domain-containing protein [Myxococcota bacterium]|nr:VWA domain-containing protein [Myxococcota bacterium]
MKPTTRQAPKSQISETTKLLALLAAVLAAPSVAQEVRRPAEPAPIAVKQQRVPKVQIAILLDNSGSMGGLLNQARTQIWKIVNTFATARRDGVRPRLEIALYEYGDGVRRHAAFTDDLDAVSEKLFGIGISGGDEYCGQVIHSATRELEWSGNPDDLKLIYIAGNEPFTQGPVNYKTAIAEAKKKGIVVNTIHCGGEDASWRQGALFAAGDHFVINQNAAIAYVPAPQDAEIARLGQALNQTYVGYGTQGRQRKELQVKQDAQAAAAAPSAALSRTVSKSGAFYNNAGWDVVDAAKNGKKVEELADDELPAEMKDLDKAGRREFVAKKAQEREQIQKRIKELNAEREKFVASQAPAAPEAETLDTALIKSVKTQGEKKAFRF